MYQSRERVNRTLVVLTLSDDTEMTVSMRMPLSNRLADALNAPDMFLDVMTAGGEQQFIAKSDIRSVRSMELPKADQLDLDARQAGFADVDPHAVLQVEKGASPEEIRHAYHRMARLYHPDRIAAYELPPEIKDYARAMLVRINLAFEQLRR
jgi:DnaJ like chaperone protein